MVELLGRNCWLHQVKVQMPKTVNEVQQIYRFEMWLYFYPFVLEREQRSCRSSMHF